MSSPVPAAGVGDVVADETQLERFYLNMYLTGGQSYANVSAHVHLSPHWQR